MLIKFQKIVIIFLLFYPTLVFAQPRHVKGIHMYGVLFSSMNKNYSVGVVYQKYLNDCFSFKVNGVYESLNKGTTDYKNVFVNPEILYKVLSNKKNFYVNLKAGGAIGNGSAKSNIINTSRFFLAENLGLNFEVLITARFKIDFDLEQRIYQNTYFGHYMYGYKINLLYSF
jgi:hypothetical protein